MKDQHNTKLDEIIDKVDANSKDISSLKTDISELKSGVSGLKSDVDGLKKESSRTLVLMEDMSGKMDLLVEVIQTLATKEDLAKTNAELAEVKSDVKIMKLALTDTNRDVTNHETRITRLETKAA